MRVHGLPILATMVLGVLLLSGVVLAKDKYCHNNCKGTDSGEQLSGDGSKNTIRGLGGPDSIYGNGAGDTLFGGTGGDGVHGGSGKDYEKGGSGCDRLWGKIGYDTIVDESGGCSGVKSFKDKLLGGEGNDTIRAQDGKEDIISGGPGRDTAYVDPVDTVTGVEVERCPGGCNHPPVAKNDKLTTNENQSKDNIDVIANDTDVDGDTLSVSSLTNPPHGDVWQNGDGTLEYSPDDNYHGPDSFDYTVSDGHGGKDKGTVDVTVSALP